MNVVFIIFSVMTIFFTVGFLVSHGRNAAKKKKRGKVRSGTMDKQGKIRAGQ